MFLHALATALIDAIPLSVLTKLRNFLRAWVYGGAQEGTVRACMLRGTVSDIMQRYFDARSFFILTVWFICFYWINTKNSRRKGYAPELLNNLSTQFFRGIPNSKLIITMARSVINPPTSWMGKTRSLRIR